MKIRKRTWESGGKTRVAWQLDYVDAQGRRRRPSFETKAEAEAAMREFVRSLVAAASSICLRVVETRRMMPAPASKPRTPADTRMSPSGSR